MAFSWLKWIIKMVTDQWLLIAISLAIKWRSIQVKTERQKDHTVCVSESLSASK